MTTINAAAPKVYVAPPTLDDKDQVKAIMENRTKSEEASYALFLPKISKGDIHEAFFFDYGSRIAQRMNLPPSSTGAIEGVLLMNVSGHNGRSSADKWALDNAYNVTVTFPDGKKQTLSNQRNAAKGTAEYVTEIPLSLPRQAGITVIEAYPLGSAGVYGYEEGRRIEIHTKGDNDYQLNGKAAETFWHAANPYNPDEEELKEFAEWRTIPLPKV
jgi:hypothetical protein